MKALLAVAVALACAIHCRRVAKADGRSGAGWFVGGLLFSLLAVAAVHLLRQQKKLACPECAHAIVPGARTCPACGFALPDIYSLSTLVDPGTAYDGKCPTCATPYRLSDYRADAAEIRCSRCGAALPRQKV